MDATLEAVAIQIGFFLLSILGAWIVLRILKGTASIKNKGAQFGGAAAMFVAMFILLNRYVPEMRDGILSEARAGQTLTVSTPSGGSTPQQVEVSLSPAQQRISSRELNQLDKNKYVVESALGIALLQPPNDGWTTGIVESVDSVSLVDVPMVAMGVGMFKSMLGEDLISHPIFALKEKKYHTLTLTAISEVRGARMNFNPFADKAFVRKSMEANLSAAAIMDENVANSLKEHKEELLDEIEKTVGAQLADGFERYVQRTLPIEKHIQNGVYVTTFDIADPSSPALTEIYKSMSPLDRAIQSLALKGIQVGGGRNLKVDQAQGIASYEGTQRLRKVIVDGVETDTTLNNLGFLVAADKRIIFVQLIYLDMGDGLSISIFLKKALDALYFST
jgi:hypothetical protein